MLWHIYCGGSGISRHLLTSHYTPLLLHSLLQNHYTLHIAHYTPVLLHSLLQNLPRCCSLHSMQCLQLIRLLQSNNNQMQRNTSKIVNKYFHINFMGNNKNR